MKLESSIITKYSGLLFLIVAFIVIFAIISTFSSQFYNKASRFEREGYDNLANPGQYSKSDENPILDSYKFTGRKEVNHNNYSTNWWQYPIFKLGSYSQITNNLRYRKNPDDGTCITPDFCGVLYKDEHVLSNISKPLPPVPNGFTKTRVNYYTTC